MDAITITAYMDNFRGRRKNGGTYTKRGVRETPPQKMGVVLKWKSKGGKNKFHLFPEKKTA